MTDVAGLNILLQNRRTGTHARLDATCICRGLVVIRTTDAELGVIAKPRSNRPNLPFVHHLDLT